MKKIILSLILMSTAATAFASTPKLAHGGLGEVVAGTILGLFAFKAIENVITPQPTVYYVEPTYVYPTYMFDPYTQCYVPCY